ncbi:MAG: MoaD/ThiS family protein [Planctomycetes bacterium]|nr:MoaD/ThiS family protein [Planctomycetota bacterium]
MRIRVKLFAVARDLAGRSELELELPSGANVAVLRAALVRDVPAFGPLLPHMQIAIDSRYATDDEPIGPHSEVAIIPPVSGG